MAMTTRAAVWPGWARTVARPGPERWMWWVAAGSWVLLLAESARNDLVALGVGAGATHGGHAQLGGSAWAGVLETSAMWCAMVAATMLPLIVPNVRFAAQHSPGGRGGRTARAVVAGWSSVWAAASVVLLLGTWAVSSAFGAAWTFALACAVALAWHFTPSRRHALARCRLMLVPPAGGGASRACVRYGLGLGRDCVLSCGPLMAVMAAAGHEVLLMAVLGWVAWRDRRLPSF